MQTAQKKARSDSDVNGAFAAMLSESKPNIFYSESIRDVVEEILDLQPVSPTKLVCSIRLDEARAAGEVQEISSSKNKIVIRVLMTPDDAWKIFNSVDTISEVTVNDSDNLAQNRRVSNAKIARLSAQNLCLLSLKLLKF